MSLPRAPLFAGGPATSRVGFGCGRLVGGASARTSRAIVEAALSLGITHFDVAPSYGLGLAEDVLGEVLPGARDVTVATKTGISRGPGNPHLLSMARRVLGPIVRQVPWLMAPLLRSRPFSAPRGRFGRDDIHASIEDSLRRLRRDRADLLLLHEPNASTMSEEAGVTLNALVASGQVGTYGSSTGAGLAGVMPFGHVLQYRYEPEVAPSDAATVILHGMLRYLLPRTQAAIKHEPALMRALGFDPADPAAAAGLVITAALASRLDAFVLLSASTPERLRIAMRAIDWDVVRGTRRLDTSALAALLSGE